ncbi:ankyrin repeat-containing protein [Cavenderia fasciculata]|uniref:Ankyrin repeat-containing protein n=1 Tax=Cavenderia fasciculata TaxID=261658 RepID=F4Q6D8_CACFS|nr:ankyrin repeat-containing protein [Cavenderia fasciculata]EGG16448.1 ankyrin repeat-containing protein [Cavenderia fasciculata]|eukprot:XP_004354848.1 ankyrin repeat-containing protein [Cavenderia fasciculata]
MANHSHGYGLLIDSIKTKNESAIYTNIINNLKNNDINTQTCSLTLINSIISYSNNPVEILDYLEDFNLSLTLKATLGSTDNYFKQQILKLQILKLQAIFHDSTTMYSKEDPTHEKLLERLWELMFPCEVFKPVDERWKLIGFQGKDPSTDFRGMGIAGLKHLLYFAEYHTDTFKHLAFQQQSLPQNISSDRYYPLAVCGIHITSMLLELMKPPTNTQDLTNDQIVIYPMLFESKNSLEQIYCVVIEIFAMVWDEGNAKYMDFKKVIVFLKNQITESLIKSSTIQEFKSNNYVIKKLVDLKKVFMDSPQQGPTKKSSQGRQSKSFNEDRKSFDYINRSVDSQHDLLATRVTVDDENGLTNSSGSSYSYTTNSCASMTYNNNTDSIYSSSASSSPAGGGENGGNTAIHVAICSLQYDIVSHYLSNVNMLNITNANGMTPLNLACANSTTQMIELILATPGISLTTQAKNEVVKSLLHYGSNPNLFNKKGETSLHISIRQKNRDLIQLLIQYGSDVSLNNSSSPSHHNNNHNNNHNNHYNYNNHNQNNGSISHSYSHSHTSLQNYGSSPISISNKSSIQIGRERNNYTSHHHSNSNSSDYNPSSSPPSDLSIAGNHTTSAGSSLMSSIVGRGRLTNSFSSHSTRYTTQQKLDIIKRCLSEATIVVDQITPTDTKYKENIKRATENIKNCKILLNSLK